jgi:hypothetical protein
MSLPTPPNVDPPNAKASAPTTASELERLSLAVVTVLNEKDFDFTSAAGQEVELHMSPEWRGQMDTIPGLVTWEEQKSFWKERAETMPDIVWMVRDVLVDVDSRKGTANVHLEMEVVGMGGVKLLAINENRWIRTRGKWLCHRTVGMRGTPGNSGMP